MPPGPKGLPLFGLAFQVLRDPLETLRRLAREYGDIVCVPIVNQHRIFLNHPDYIEQVCIFQQAKFHKSKLTKDVTAALARPGPADQRRRFLAPPAPPGTAGLSPQPHQ